MTNPTEPLKETIDRLRELHVVLKPDSLVAHYGLRRNLGDILAAISDNDVNAAIEIINALPALLDAAEECDRLTKEAEAFDNEFARCEGCANYIKRKEFVEGDPPDLDVCSGCAKASQRSDAAEQRDKLLALLKPEEWQIKDGSSERCKWCGARKDWDEDHKLGCKWVEAVTPPAEPAEADGDDR